MSLVTYYASNFLVTGEILLVYKWEPGPFGMSMLTGFFIFWLVSILTLPEKKERTESFFDNMRRKSDSEKPGPDGKKPMAYLTGDDLLLLDLPGWGKKERRKNFFKRYREDLVGFLLSWGMVGILVLLAWGIMQI